MYGEHMVNILCDLCESDLEWEGVESWMQCVRLGLLFVFLGGDSILKEQGEQ